MRIGRSHAKGASFERQVCKRLSLWVTQGARDDLYWRTAMSGGRATLQGKKGKANVTQVGDICSIDPLGDPLLCKVLIECKFWRDLDILAGVLNDAGRLHRFWEEACDEAQRCGRAPFLVARQNQLPTLLLTPWDTAHELDIMYEPRMCIAAWRLQPAVFLFDSVVPTLKSYEVDKKPKLRRRSK